MTDREGKNASGDIWLECFGSDSKESACNAGDPGLVPGSGRSRSRKWQPAPGFLSGNPMNRGAWRATVHGVAKSQTRLSD